MAYADRTQLAAFVGSSVTLPANPEQDRLLERASELVDVVTLNRIDPDNEQHLEAAEKATVAQVEYWLNQGEAVSSGGAVGSYSIGNLSISFSGAPPGIGGTMPSLSPRARHFLLMAGLLYRGVRTG